MENKRSIGTIVLGIYLLLCVVPSFLLISAMCISSCYAKDPLGIILDKAMRFVLIASPFLFLVAGTGMLMRKKWARLMVIFLSPLISYITVGILGILLLAIIPQARSVFTVIVLCGMIFIGISIIYYLTRPKVREQFK